MNVINPYLTFNGNCREAMSFYQQCFGGELYFQTIGDSPISERMPARMKNCILHAELRMDKLVIMGTDMVNESGLLKGNAVTLMLQFENDKEIWTCYHQLSKGGNRTYPLALTFWGVLLGGLTDKFGYHWLLTVKNSNTPKTIT
jgi:PhnB protein